MSQNSLKAAIPTHSTLDIVFNTNPFPPFVPIKRAGAAHLMPARTPSIHLQTNAILCCVTASAVNHPTD